jgi:hypothetical protein
MLAMGNEWKHAQLLRATKKVYSTGIVASAFRACEKIA